MDKLTITEALQEIKTIGKRIQKKREAIVGYFIRDVRLKDPLEKEGGSVEYIRRERQSIADLQQRIVAIRTQIQRSNLASVLVLHGVTRTVAEWLTWRREVSAGETAFLGGMASGLVAARQKTAKEGRRIVADESKAGEQDLVSCVNETELHADVERHEQLLGDLDGKLSLLNATTVIEI